MGVYRFKKTVTVAATTGSCNTHKITAGLGHKLLVKSATATTRFRVNVTDRDSDIIRSYNFRQNVLDDEKPLILQGINTVNITDSTANEDFTVKMWVEE